MSKFNRPSRIVDLAIQSQLKLLKIKSGAFLMLESPGTEPSGHTILVVDDEELIRNLIITFLSKLGHLCVTAIDGVDALDKINGNKFDAVITDIKMPNMDGIILTREISTRYPGLPVMVMTAHDEEYSAGTAISVGAWDFIKKPFSLNEFAIRLQKMIRDSKSLKLIESEKNEDQDMEELFNWLESPERTEDGKEIHEDMQDLEVHEDMQDLRDELEKVLKKR